MLGSQLGEVLHNKVRSADVVASYGGRLIKTLGDEIFFVAADPAAAAEVGKAYISSQDASKLYIVDLSKNSIVKTLDIFTPTLLEKALPGNVALAVGEAVTYAEVKMKETGERLILARALLGSLDGGGVGRLGDGIGRRRAAGQDRQLAIVFEVVHCFPFVVGGGGCRRPAGDTGLPCASFKRRCSMARIWCASCPRAM